MMEELHKFFFFFFLPFFLRLRRKKVFFVDEVVMEQVIKRRLIVPFFSIYPSPSFFRSKRRITQWNTSSTKVLLCKGGKTSFSAIVSRSGTRLNNHLFNYF